MYKNNKIFIKKFCGSTYKSCLLLIFLAVVMVVFVAAMLKLNLERIPKRNVYMPNLARLANPREII